MSRSVVVSFLLSPVASAGSFGILQRASPPAYLSSRSWAPEAQCPASQSVRRSCWRRALYILDHELYVRMYRWWIRCDMYCEVTPSGNWCLFVRKIEEALMIQVSWNSYSSKLDSEFWKFFCLKVILIVLLIRFFNEIFNVRTNKDFQ